MLSLLLIISVIAQAGALADSRVFYGERATDCRQSVDLPIDTGKLTNCQVRFTGHVSIVDCQVGGCRYFTNGGITVHSDVLAPMEAATAVVTDSDGSLWTCRSISDVPTFADGCYDSVVSFATVSPGNCTGLYVIGLGFIGPGAQELPPGYASLQGVGNATRFASLCRAADGTPSLQSTPN
jgi:hypothetical protein